MKTKIFFGYAIAWIAVSVAIIAGLIITEDANCLWAFLIPGFLRINVSEHSDDEEEEKK